MSIEHGSSPEELDEDGLTPEQRAYADDMLTLPKNEVKTISESERTDCEPKITEFQKMLSDFEANHSLEELNAITGLDTTELARANPIRESARLALIPITEMLNEIRDRTNITPERYVQIDTEYKRLWNAVGVIQNEVFTHEVSRE